ncbi:MAG: ABC transporter permease [Hyphomicrobiaceae bacterium]
MRLLESFRTALRALRTNLLRSILTTLGIMIGVASVIVMVAVGSGARNEVEKRIAALGTSQLQLRPGSSRVGGRFAGAETNLPLSEGDVAAIREKVPGVVALTGTISRAAPIVRGNQNWLTTVAGVHPDFTVVRDWEVSDGRFFSSLENRSAAKVAVVGVTVAKQIAGDGSPVGEMVRILNSPFRIIGVLEAKGQSGFGRDQDDVVYVPIATARSHLVTRNTLVPDQVGALSIKFDGETDLGEAKGELETLMRARRRVQPGRDDNFFVRDLAELVRTRASTTQTLGLLLGATAAISLIVGGIGIMNIMLVSVTERTREIGLRMAVGGRRRDILAQFLVEAVVLCLIGGLIGVTIGVLATVAIAQSANWPVLIAPEIVAVALAASALTGIVFGFVPARRAAHLNPIDALRSE